MCMLCVDFQFIYLHHHSCFPPVFLLLFSEYFSLYHPGLFFISFAIISSMHASFIFSWPIHRDWHVSKEHWVIWFATPRPDIAGSSAVFAWRFLQPPGKIIMYIWGLSNRRRQSQKLCQSPRILLMSRKLIPRKKKSIEEDASQDSSWFLINKLTFWLLLTHQFFLISFYYQ